MSSRTGDNFVSWRVYLKRFLQSVCVCVCHSSRRSNSCLFAMLHCYNSWCFEQVRTKELAQDGECRMLTEIPTREWVNCHAVPTSLSALLGVILPGQSRKVETVFVVSDLVVVGISLWLANIDIEAILVLLGASKTGIRGIVGADQQQHPTCHETIVIRCNACNAVVSTLCFAGPERRYSVHAQLRRKNVRPLTIHTTPSTLPHQQRC